MPAGLEVWVVLGVVGTVLTLFVVTELSADALLFGGLAVLVITGVVDVKTALSGFANEGMFTVGLLFIVAAGLRATGVVDRMAGLLLGRPTPPGQPGPSLRRTLSRLLLPVAAASALLNNTPIVAALMPAITDWCRKNRMSPSKLLMPLSFATILGGTVTVIGTSTNLVVTGLILDNIADHPGLVPIGIFDISPIGLPLAIGGVLSLVFLAPLLLKDRRPPVSTDDDPREYTTEFLVRPGGPLVGLDVEAAGLRHLPNAFLVELHREDAVLPAVDPNIRLHGGDRLIFACPREAVVDLKRIPGLQQAPNLVFALVGHPSERQLVEAVVGPANRVLGLTLRDGKFRSTYNAVVIAVARDGERLNGKLGDVVLQIGDCLLLEAQPNWVASQRDRRDFFLVSNVDDSATFRHDKAGLALVIVGAMVTAAALEWATMFQAALMASAALLATRCLTSLEARRSIEWPVLIAIAAAFGIGESFRIVGIDQIVANGALRAGADTPFLALISIYIVTAILTELITNNAAAALMFPFALSLPEALEVSPMPFCVALMFAASASFSTPIGYQTNLMVMGPGGYRFTDYVRVGGLLQVAAGIVTLALVPLVFPF